MATKLYAVINTSNQVVNVILVNEPMPAKYWPGYGAALLSIDGVAPTGGPAGITVHSRSWSQRPQIGDVVNTATGTVLRYVPSTFSQVNPNTGQSITVSSAPQVILQKDVEPNR